MSDKAGWMVLAGRLTDDLQRFRSDLEVEVFSHFVNCFAFGAAIFLFCRGGEYLIIFFSLFIFKIWSTSFSKH